MILIAFRHGLRVSELIDLRWDQDVDLESRRLLCRRRKRGRDGIHRLADGELNLLKELRALHPTEEFVFPSGRGGKMSRSNVNRMLKEAGTRAGLPNAHPHALRHACGYELAMRGIDTRRLQTYLGHRSIMSTVVYTDLAMHATDSVWA
jgi:integrase